MRQKEHNTPQKNQVRQWNAVYGFDSTQMYRLDEIESGKTNIYAIFVPKQKVGVN